MAKIIKKCLNVFIFGVFLPFIILVFSSYCDSIFLQMSLRLISFIIVLISLLSFIFVIEKNKKFKKKQTLYQWMDELIDFDERIIFLLKKQNVNYSTIENLNFIKFHILKMTNKDKFKLKLYKAFYEQKSKQTGEELYLRTVVASLVPIIGLFLFRYNNFLFSQIEFLLYIIFSYFIFVAFVSVYLSYNKKRYGILISIIDICIEEIEDNEKQENVK